MKKRMLTEAQRGAMEKLLHDMKLIAGRVGPQHAFWYPISDLEAWLSGRKPMLNMGPDAFIQECQKMMEAA